jgi:hypothetical protein
VIDLNNSKVSAAARRMRVLRGRCVLTKTASQGRSWALLSIFKQVYNLATRVRVAKKREVLDAWAIELRRIVCVPSAIKRLAA